MTPEEMIQRYCERRRKLERETDIALYGYTIEDGRTGKRVDPVSVRPWNDDEGRRNPATAPRGPSE